MKKSDIQIKPENTKSDVQDNICPHCASDKVLKQPRRKEEFFNVYVCFECDYIWDDKAAYLFNPGICE